MKNYLEIKKIIDEADAIIIGAGAGLSTCAGVSYDTKNFGEEFPELVEKYNMTDMYTSSFYHFETEEERWSYWAKHINYLYNVEAKEIYKKLYKIVSKKDYFVITTNVDGQFLKAGFNEKRVFEVQGSLSKMQCAVACHNKLYNDLDMVDKMLKEERKCKVPTRLVPHCPVCGGKMEVNLRKDAYFVEDDNWYELSSRYNSFIQENREKKLVLLELGVGFNTPSIIRFPFEKMTIELENTTLIRVNDKYVDTFLDIDKDKVKLLKEDCAIVINNI